MVRRADFILPWRYQALADGIMKIHDKLSITTPKGVEDFVRMVKEKTVLSELTFNVFSDFIDKILIHLRVKKGHRNEQCVTIIYKGVGSIENTD